MNLKSKVYVVRDSEKEIKAIDGSLKNLLATVKRNFEYSRSNIDRTSMLARLKTGQEIVVNLKKAQGYLTISAFGLNSPLEERIY